MGPDPGTLTTPIPILLNQKGCVEPELKVSETRLTFLAITMGYLTPRNLANASQTPECHYIPVCLRFGYSNLLSLAPLNS